MARLPDAAPYVRPYLERLQSSHLTLIHGDFSPKNVLVDGDRVWLIDFEVANAGDPAFDVAFMIHHILIEAVRQPVVAARLLSVANMFWTTYISCVDNAIGPAWGEVAGQTACLLLARVYGKSKVVGLTREVQEVVRTVALRTFKEAPSDMAGIWQLVGAAP
jgi:5-methylthioribose kinase